MVNENSELQQSEEQQPKPGLARRFGRGTYRVANWFLPLSPVGGIVRRVGSISQLVGQFYRALRGSSRAAGGEVESPTARPRKPAPRWVFDVLLGVGIALLLIAPFGAGLGVAAVGLTLVAVAVQHILVYSYSHNLQSGKRSE